MNSLLWELPKTYQSGFRALQRFGSFYVIAPRSSLHIRTRASMKNTYVMNYVRYYQIRVKGQMTSANVSATYTWSIEYVSEADAGRCTVSIKNDQNSRRRMLQITNHKWLIHPCESDAPIEIAEKRSVVW